MPLEYQKTRAAIAAALNDPDQSLIGNPREGVYKVAFTTSTVQAAVEFARLLARIGITPTTVVTHDQFGNPEGAAVTIRSLSDLTGLLNATGTSLRPERLEELRTLVLARKPIPDETLERIWNAHQRGMSDIRIRDELDRGGFIEGSGKAWTVRKVRAARRAYEERLQPQEAAA